MMLHHVSVGARDVPKACGFYDKALGALGFKRVMEFLPYAVGYGLTSPEFWVQTPADGQAPSAGNGVHIAFAARSERAVQAFHAAAMAAGGKDEGAPGPRPDYGPTYYGAFVRDPDGNKIEAMVHVQASAKAKTTAKSRRKARPAKKAKRKRR